jgi:hypothetical protein
MPNTFFVAVKIVDLYEHRNYISTGQKELVGFDSFMGRSQNLRRKQFLLSPRCLQVPS